MFLFFFLQAEDGIRYGRVTGVQTCALPISRAPIPTPRNHATAGVVNGKIYVIGGRVGNAFITAGGSNVDVVEEYDPATDAWGSARARMPSARSAMASGVLGGRIYVSGGEGQNAQMMYTF